MLQRLTAMQALRRHMARYPRMTPQDAVKLLYQSEFGGGHMIADRAAAAVRLRAETAGVGLSPDAPVIEDIGEGMARFHLRAMARAGVSQEELLDWFIQSAAMKRGETARFLQKLESLRALASGGETPFRADALERYLMDYKRDGMPAVSHSEAYRLAYAPAYRVVAQSILPPTILRMMI